MKLKNKNVLITGGSQGFGKAISDQCLKDGANIVICSRNEKDLYSVQQELAEKYPNNKIYAKACDVSDETQVNNLILFALQSFEIVDAVVLNAGVYGPMGPTESVSIDEWKYALNVNLYGVLFPCRAIIPHLKKQHGGKIIMVSGGGATNPMPNISAYAASKAASLRLMETLSEELKPFNIYVNSVAPGALKTRLIDQVLSAGENVVGKGFFEKNIKWKENGAVPLELGAALVTYLISEESNGVSGKLISAQWDDWQQLHTHLDDLKNSDIYCLRRIVPSDRNKTWK